MKILFINKFLYPKGGDAICTLATGEVLKANGHEVMFWGMKHPDNASFPHEQDFIDNVDYNQSGGIKNRIRTASNLLYSTEAKKKVELVIKKEKPDIVHLHNFAHQISPSILHVFKKYEIPVVMTMHDYKLVCPVYTLFSKGEPCDRCAGGKYYQCLTRRCTKNSFSKSLLNTMEMYLHHSLLHIYDLIDVFISPSKFLMDKCQKMGFKGQIIHVPNFVDCENLISQYAWRERSLVYMGRLSQEKGLGTLIDAMKGLDVVLKIIGEGPLSNDLEMKVKESGIKNVVFLGYKKGEELTSEIQNSMAVIIPSQWYENNPLSILEAFALGKPVIGSRIGGIAELVADQVTGLTFESGNVQDLHDCISTFIKKDSKDIEVMGRNARLLVEREYSQEIYYQRLMGVYQKLLSNSVTEVVSLS